MQAKEDVGDELLRVNFKRSGCSHVLEAPLVLLKVAAAPATWQLGLAEPAASQREEGGADVAAGVPFALEAEARDRFNNRSARPAVHHCRPRRAANADALIPQVAAQADYWRGGTICLRALHCLSFQCIVIVWNGTHSMPHVSCIFIHINTVQ